MLTQPNESRSSESSSGWPEVGISIGGSIGISIGGNLQSLPKGADASGGCPTIHISFASSSDLYNVYNPFLPARHINSPGLFQWPGMAPVSTAVSDQIMDNRSGITDRHL